MVLVDDRMEKRKSIKAVLSVFETHAASVQRDATGCVTTEPGYESSKNKRKSTQHVFFNITM